MKGVGEEERPGFPFICPALLIIRTRVGNLYHATPLPALRRSSPEKHARLRELGKGLLQEARSPISEGRYRIKLWLVKFRFMTLSRSVFLFFSWRREAA